VQHDRRRLLQHIASGAAAGALGHWTGAAQAQSPAFPSRMVRVVVPYPPGGTTDIVARGICERLAALWGQPVVVDNRAGASGMIGTAAVAKAAPDGHTLLLTVTPFVQAPGLYANAPYDPLRDFAPVSEIGTSHLVVVATPQLPVRQLKELPAYIGTLGQPLPYGTYGQGSSAHLQMEILSRTAKLPLVHVPYKGESPLINDAVGGQVPLAVISAAAAAQHARADKVRPLAVIGTSRSPLLPDVPTFQEAGFTGLERQGWLGLFAPAATPAGLVERISADVNRAVADKALRERMAELGIFLKGSSPSSFAAFVKAEHAYWTQAIRAADVKLD
jgi:tripartite-type tricarboxylate transporter receptor subunit TctC